MEEKGKCGKKVTMERKKLIEKVGEEMKAWEEGMIWSAWNISVEEKIHSMGNFVRPYSYPKG